MKTAIGNDFKFDAVKKFLKRTVENHWSQLSSKHGRKIFNLYGGQVFKKEIINPVVNLTEIELDEEMKQIFSFGMNCHLKTKRDKRRTKI